MENISCFSVAARALRIGAYDFINKAQFNAGFTDGLKLKDGAVTAVMIPVMSRNRRCFSSLMTRAGQPVNHMRSTNSKPQPSIQFPKDKIKPRPTFVLVPEAVSLGYTSQ
ncbi:hypothetical protein DPX16_5944 [Anabarilius grahami]|uniref:Uncharacterized protein n=1 Tax=Anabarilius grahami TaxID=495550 RepID=A0A3N0Y415_ANAGA|nr:hypothetical protein DPX16_5944 [Anabarilius grahami]